MGKEEEEEEEEEGKGTLGKLSKMPEVRLAKCARRKRAVGRPCARNRNRVGRRRLITEFQEDGSEASCESCNTSLGLAAALRRTYDRSLDRLRRRER
ncbi:hypothetical protein KM043_010252 [Ampulex compressa]|nr:hypothetical protein KM043_010252 [Ampulex compressa]